MRHVDLTAAADLDRPEIEALVVAALTLAKLQLDPNRIGMTIIKADEQKRRTTRRSSEPPAQHDPKRR